MHPVTPSVSFLASPKVNIDYVLEWLRELGAENFSQDLELDLASDSIDAERLVEMAGRRCYLSFEEGLNPNVTRVRPNTSSFIRNIIKVGHGSVLEHVQLSFAFENVSRVFTHELVRHRAGTAISQESLRFVRLDDIGFWIPPAFQDDTTAQDIIGNLVGNSEKAYQRLLAASAIKEGVDSFDALSFERKKYYTSAARRVVPLGLATGMVWSANIRALRHIINMRTAPGAEEEIRIVFNELARLVKETFPDFFFDLEPVWDELPPPALGTNYGAAENRLAHWKTEYAT